MSLFDSPQNNQGFSMNRGSQIDPVRFQQALSRLDENSLNQLVQQARYLGMSVEQIQEGLRYIQNMK